jgi:hypothetical protein
MFTERLRSSFNDPSRRKRRRNDRGAGVIMAISKKYSRRIVVDGVAYRWRVMPEVEYDGYLHDGLLLVNVWSEEGSKQVLRLRGGSHPMRRVAAPEVIITPRRVAAGIRAALRAGWPTGKRRFFDLVLPPTDES